MIGEVVSRNVMIDSKLGLFRVSEPIRNRPKLRVGAGVEDDHAIDIAQHVRGHLRAPMLKAVGPGHGLIPIRQPLEHNGERIGTGPS